MQNFIDQAVKNDVLLLDKGSCQFCGANLQHGIFECMEVYNKSLDLLDLSNSTNHLPRFLSVDAHALQHPEIHGRWSNHFHLTRLYLILEKNVNWNYKTSPLLSNFLNAYKLNHPSETLAPPAILKRGKLTALDLTKAATAEECVELITSWAGEVYQAWSSNYPVVSRIGDRFLAENK